MYIIDIMKKLILASNNKGKIAEIKNILGDRFEVVSLKECGIEIDVEETGTTFEENAFIKAKAIFDIAGLPVISDDSGLVVYALNGEPGVYSARYAGEQHCDADNNAKLLRNLEGVIDRSAAFVCCAVYYDGVSKIVATGKVEGEILFKAEGESGFGYDPLFYSKELCKSFGVATFEEKNSVSHRARAFKELATNL